MAPPRALSDYYPSGRRRGPSPLELAARRPHAREGAGQARGPAFGGAGRAPHMRGASSMSALRALLGLGVLAAGSHLRRVPGQAGACRAGPAWWGTWRPHSGGPGEPAGMASPAVKYLR